MTRDAGAARRVVYTDISDLDPRPGARLLRERGVEVVVASPGLASDEFARLLATADAIVCGYRRLDHALLASSARAGIVATLSVGHDMVDIDAAEMLGIQVCNVPPYASEEVATHALALMLAAERNLVRTAWSTREGAWDPVAYGAPRRIGELTLGIVGYGRIGRELARLAGPLFGGIVAHDPSAASASADHDDVTRVGLDELLGRADVVSLHAPSTDSTRGMIDSRAIASMRPGAGLVNVARGDLVDHVALGSALESGALRYAALDVTHPEPLPASHPLLNLENVILTPHVAFASEVTVERYSTAPAVEILRWLDDEPPLSPVNRPIRPRRPV